MATADSFKVKVLTPSGLVLEERVSSAKIPSSDGEIGVLPHHTKYSGIVGEGTLELTASPSNETKRIKIAGGLIHFADDTLTILADRIV